jgi:UDP-glucose 4-epimerase
MKPKRILVTGGAGFIGSHLVDHLIAQGEAVTVLDDFSTGTRKNLGDAMGAGDLRIIEGSVLDAAAVAEAIKECNRAFHLAVQCVRRSLGYPLENHAVNATGSLVVLNAARQFQLERFVYCSSSEVYGNTSFELLREDETVCDPTTVYGAAKLCGELYTRAFHRCYGLPVTIVRPFNAYGPRAHDRGDLAEVIPRFLIRMLNGQPPVIFGDGSNARDFTYVTDVARGLGMAMQSGALVGGTVNIAYGDAISVRAVAETIARACGIGATSLQFSSPRPGDIHCLRADTSRARDLLGYKAGITFQEGVLLYRDWFLRTNPDPRAMLEERVENWTVAGDGGNA